jgi:hypothetical protein
MRKAKKTKIATVENYAVIDCCEHPNPDKDSEEIIVKLFPTYLKARRYAARLNRAQRKCHSYQTNTHHVCKVKDLDPGRVEQSKRWGF